jgi:hypothetical protein
MTLLYLLSYKVSDLTLSTVVSVAPNLRASIELMLKENFVKFLSFILNLVEGNVRNTEAV